MGGQERIRIAVIDDGIEAAKLVHPEALLGDFIVEGGGIIRPRRAEDFSLRLHGTRCAAIIEAYAREVEFISLCIFDKERLKTDSRKLVTALEWCLSNEIPLIHMSVGTRLLADYEELRHITVLLAQRGSLLVAAGNNAGTYTMPACLGGVLGVAAKKQLTGAAYGYQNLGNGIQIVASAFHTFSEEENPFLTSIANSYAAPTVTAAVCRILAEEKLSGTPQIVQKLLPKETYRALRPDFIEDALWIDLAGTDGLEDCFFFSYEKVSYEKAFFYEEVFPCQKTEFWQERGAYQETKERNKKRCLVLIPGEDSDLVERVLDAVRQNIEAFYGILYGGGEEADGNQSGGWDSVISRLKELKKELLVWWEPDCGIASWENAMSDRFLSEQKLPVPKAGTEQEEEEGEGIPYVLIQTIKKEGIRLACKLQKQFLELEYQCVAASNWEYAYLYGLEYIPADAKRTDVIDYLEKVFTPELVILLDKEGGDWGLEEDAVYGVREEELEKEGLCEEIVAYFS